MIRIYHISATESSANSLINVAMVKITMVTFALLSLSYPVLTEVRLFRLGLHFTFCSQLNQVTKHKCEQEGLTLSNLLVFTLFKIRCCLLLDKSSSIDKI